MRSRTGFARLLPLIFLTGMAARRIAVLVSARPVQAPGPSASAARTSPPPVDQVRIVTERECWTDDPHVLHYPGEGRIRCVLRLADARLVDTFFPDPPVR